MEEPEGRRKNLLEVPQGKGKKIYTHTHTHMRFLEKISINHFLKVDFFGGQLACYKVKMRVKRCYKETREWRTLSKTETS